jgi:hypothetical protein
MLLQLFNNIFSFNVLPFFCQIFVDLWVAKEYANYSKRQKNNQNVDNFYFLLHIQEKQMTNISKYFISI